MIQMIVVPWFSRQEWLEVYESIFSEDIQLWKDARDTMLAWQARVDRLPAGVDVTLPLLEARIIEADTTIDDSVKSMFLATAVQRFVSSIVKLPQTNYYRTQSMHHLALDIGLPMYLVDLRNEIVHGHGGWSGGDTIHKAVDTSFQWIKGYYWDVEWNKLNNVGPTVPEETPQISEEKWKSFTSSLDKYTKTVIADRKKDKRSPALKTACTNLLNVLREIYSDGSQECLEAIVSHLLLYDTNPFTADIVNNVMLMQKCGCIFEYGIISGVAPVIQEVAANEDSIETILSCLINKAKDNSNLAREWLYMIVGSILGLRKVHSPNSQCKQHTMQLEGLEVEWRAVVVELFESEETWAVALASRIMDCTDVGLSEEQKDNLKYLFMWLKMDEKKSTNNTSNLEVFSIDDVVEAAHTTSDAIKNKVEKLRNSVISPGIDIELEDSTPLGVLPHQKGNLSLYNELLLHYPDGDQCAPMAKKQRVAL